MNNKGFYNENKEWMEKVKGFFKESGFYIMIVVGLCVLAVGAVYFTTNHLISSPEEFEESLVPEGIQSDADNSKENVILNGEEDPQDDFAFDDYRIPEKPIDYEAQNNDPSDMDTHMIAEHTDDLVDDSSSGVETIATKVQPTMAPVVTKAPEKSSEKPSEKAEADDQTQEVIKLFGAKPVFIMPVSGKLHLDYAIDRLLYSKTLDEWRTHSGIDITAPRGEAVKAVADGFVKEIKTDPCYGITITIDHENGYKSIYSNLASDSMVSANQKVKAGDPISSVGNTAIFECMDPPHLHFEMYKNDKLIDPKTVLPIPKE